MTKITIALLLSVAATFAADYSAMTMEEMKAARGSVSSADKSAFQAEMQTRMQSMNSEDRQKMQNEMKQSKSGPQDGTGSKMRKGGGSGGGMRGGR